MSPLSVVALLTLRVGQAQALEVGVEVVAVDAAAVVEKVPAVEVAGLGESAAIPINACVEAAMDGQRGQ